MLDTREDVLRLLGRLEFSSSRAAIKVGVSILVAGAVALIPGYEALSTQGHWALFILILAALLWTTEAMPAFAVSLLVMGLAIVLIGHPGRGADPKAWVMFVRPWSSPLLWLFLGGLVMAEAATRTGLDRWMAAGVLGRLGRRPAPLLAGVLAVTFILSMFMSNTATTAMMLAVMAPIIHSLPREEGFAHCLLLGIPVAANLGGMGTLIGTPPNAIAASALHATPIGFGQWMLAGVPPAILLVLASWFFLRRRYPWGVTEVDISAIQEVPAGRHAPLWQKLVVMAVFTMTICLWLTTSLHGIPSPVISFLPITIFAVTGVIGADQIRRLQWDVLLLMAGGMSLGIAVSETGLAAWLVALLPTEQWGILPIIIAFVVVAVVMSNFMSNTAAANVLVPLAMALNTGQDAATVVPIALGASAAMCLPISTPPNALAYATRRVKGTDFVPIGIFVGLLAPIVTVVWTWFIL